MKQDLISYHTDQMKRWLFKTLYITCIKGRCQRQRRAAKRRQKEWYSSETIHVSKSQPSSKTHSWMRHWRIGNAHHMVDFTQKLQCTMTVRDRLASLQKELISMQTQHAQTSAPGDW